MKKIIKYIVIGFAIIVLTMICLKGFSNEDDWICRDGEWIKHGYPNAPKPTESCK
ncbi:MAG: hypothetical protein ABIC36_01820 [bacterium]